MKTMTRAGLRLATVLAAAIPLPALSYDFTPTDAEFLSWPGYCQARYVTTNVGRTSKWAGTVSGDKFSELAALESSGVEGVHHYCAGMIWLRRAQLETNETERQRMLRNGRNETEYTLSRTPETAPFRVQVAFQYASIVYEQGDASTAIRLLRDVIAADPKNPLAYSATAVMLREQGDIQAAKQVLLDGIEATQGGSAEIFYNLGLISLDLGDVQSAEIYAARAYEAGFPLPGLRNRLARAKRHD